ncbi:hypothetical protein HAX54_044012 [Datura stramonium]|uniref:Uncharacterized protein n=1 Tax=Datura stramonium TaxID=4076 RepID=A0ABS8W6F9_DATST|nr:hypothetical protein [Datura stramonium]
MRSRWDTDQWRPVIEETMEAGRACLVIRRSREKKAPALMEGLVAPENGVLAKRRKGRRRGKEVDVVQWWWYSLLEQRGRRKGAATLGFHRNSDQSFMLVSLEQARGEKT